MNRGALAELYHQNASTKARRNNLPLNRNASESDGRHCLRPNAACLVGMELDKALLHWKSHRNRRTHEGERALKYCICSWADRPYAYVLPKPSCTIEFDTNVYNTSFFSRVESWKHNLVQIFSRTQQQLSIGPQMRKILPLEVFSASFAQRQSGEWAWAPLPLWRKAFPTSIARVPGDYFPEL